MPLTPGPEVGTQPVPDHSLWLPAGAAAAPIIKLSSQAAALPHSPFPPWSHHGSYCHLPSSGATQLQVSGHFLVLLFFDFLRSALTLSFLLVKHLPGDRALSSSPASLTTPPLSPLLAPPPSSHNSCRHSAQLFFSPQLYSLPELSHPVEGLQI